MRRSEECGRLALPLECRCTTYNVKAIPVLGYTAQLADTPSNCKRLQLDSWAKLSHWPGMSFSAAAVHDMANLLKVPLIPLEPYVVASRIRTATHTFKDVTRTTLGLPADDSWLVSSQWWSSCAFIVNLEKAREGKFSKHDLANRKLKEWLEEQDEETRNKDGWQTKIQNKVLEVLPGGLEKVVQDRACKWKILGSEDAGGSWKLDKPRLRAALSKTLELLKPCNLVTKLSVVRSHHGKRLDHSNSYVCR